MFYFHYFDGLSHFFWFFPINIFRPSCFHPTKSTRAGTYISKYHESCGAFSPALSHIWATSRGTDGVELVLLYKSSELRIFFSGGEFYPNPFWFTYAFIFSICYFQNNFFTKIQSKFRDSKGKPV